MKKLLTTLVLFGLCANLYGESKPKNELSNIEKQMEKEKKYAKEQKFYFGDEYDLKGAEVDEKSLEHIEPLEPDDLDMDHVYD